LVEPLSPHESTRRRSSRNRTEMGPPVAARVLRRDVRRVLEQLRSSSSCFVPVDGASVRTHLVLDPILAREALAASDRFEKAAAGFRLRYLVGDGTATCRLPPGDAPRPPFDSLSAWRNHKRVALQPSFSHTDSEATLRITSAAVERHTAAWRPGKVVDLETTVRRISAESFVHQFQPGRGAATLIAVASLAGETRDAVDRAVRGRVRSAMDRDHRWFTEAIQLACIVDPVTREVRRRRHALRSALLEVLTDLDSRSGTLFGRLAGGMGSEGRQPRRDELLSSAISLFLAGWENTATATTWLLWLLTGAAAYQERAAAEGAIVGKARPFLRAAAQEALRMYPPVWSTIREARVATTLGGLTLDPGDVLLISPWVLHHQPRAWKRPSSFQPERFPAAASSPGYLPFGTGERACQGRAFATSQIVEIAAQLLSRWRLTAAVAVLEPRLGVVQHPVGPALVRLEGRTA
jgi:cytochrome P450